MIVLLYSANTVGAVCRRVAQLAPQNIRVAKDLDYEAQDGDFVIRWDSFRRIWDATELQTGAAVKASRNKSLSRHNLGELAPRTWFEPDDVVLPAVVRPKRHHAGLKFFVVETQAQLRKAITACGDRWYASPVLQKAQEYRVYVLQGHVTSVSKRTCNNPAQIAWNVGLGAQMLKIKRTNWPLDVVKVGIKAAEKLNLKWAAIDIAVTTTGEIVVFEANTAPGLVANAKSLPLLAKAFTYVDTHREIDPANENARAWKTLLHPSLRNG